MDEAGSGDPWTGPYSRGATSAIVGPIAPLLGHLSGTRRRPRAPARARPQLRYGSIGWVLARLMVSTSDDRA
jgi:hypothetical protein